jgi:methyltransferase-like protein/SAM-dependent methyltransferase
MAEAFPQATFVGVDLSARQIADGQKLIADAGLTNVSLRNASILDVDASYGTFDYVICHGVFSWVPKPVQEKIFEVCAKNMTPNGVAYVSYNAYPGWHMRGIIRDMMRYHARRYATPHDRTQQSRAFLNFMADTVRKEGPYASLLRSELEAIRPHADHYLYHDHLEEVNEPLYFHQFIERAAEHKLRYLGEAKIGSMLPANFGPDVAKAMKLLANDQLQIEQYLDFICNRMFRETLLIQARNTPNWQIQAECVTRLHVSSMTKPVNGIADVRSDEPVQYQTPTGVTITANRPILKAAMVVLTEVRPGTIPFGELVKRCWSLLLRTDEKQMMEETQELVASLLSGHLNADIVELRGAAVAVATRAEERPRASSVARAQIVVGYPTTRRHELAALSPLESCLLPLLDGTRNHTELAESDPLYPVVGVYSKLPSALRVSVP